MSRPPVWVRLALLALVAFSIAYVVVHRHDFDPDDIGHLLSGHGPAMVLSFVLLHCITSLAFLPRTVMGIAAGLLFGAGWGMVIGLSGAMAGALAGFLIARYVNAGLIEVESIPRLGPFLERAEAGGWRAVCAARLIPFLPHSLINYALGLTRMPIAAYALGSLAGMAPTQVVVANLGASGRLAIEGGGAWVEPTLWGVMFLALSVALPKLMKGRGRL